MKTSFCLVEVYLHSTRRFASFESDGLVDVFAAPCKCQLQLKGPSIVENASTAKLTNKHIVVVFGS
jgi:hypothetical protein